MPFFPEATEALIFDLDGTLYDQGRLRRKMFLDLVIGLAKNPLFIQGIKVLYAFRKNRERLSESGDEVRSIEKRQYAEVAQALGLSSAGSATHCE